MSSARSAVVFAMLLGISGVACTAIVLGKLDRIADYGLDDGGIQVSSSSSSGESSGKIVNNDKCSLLYGGYENAPPAYDNDCARCIKNSCGEELEYACKPDAKKAYFEAIRTCAQNPWNGNAEPDAGAGGGAWGCQPYVDAGPTAGSANPDLKHEYDARDCIREGCLQGPQPSCRQCVIGFQLPGSGQKPFGYLKDDPCGGCLEQNCKDELVACCPSDVIDKYVRYCSFTDQSEYRTTCAKLGDSTFVGDGGDDFEVSNDLYNKFDRQCAARIHKCMVANCKNVETCNP